MPGPLSETCTQLQRFPSWGLLPVSTRTRGAAFSGVLNPIFNKICHQMGQIIPLRPNPRFGECTGMQDNMIFFSQGRQPFDNFHCNVA